MGLYCVGLNHRTAPVEIRERVAVSESGLGEIDRELAAESGIDECVVISTCNRTEVYAVGDAQALEPFLRRHFDIAEDEEVPLYEYAEDDAVAHLFAVASGLDSMVLGETEVFGQVKKAYAAAHAAGCTARRLNKLFQQAFQAAKHVRSHSHIGRGATSVGSVAVDLAEKIFGRLDRCRVMVLGAGDTSRLTARALASRGASGLLVSNRSYDRAVELAREICGEAIRFDDFRARLGDVDIIIASTAAPHPIVDEAHIREALRRRRGRPLFIIDIAVPRDVHPEVAGLDAVYLYDIDALENIAEKGRRSREEQIVHCRRLIREQMEKFDIAPPAGRAIRPGDETQPLPGT